MGVYPYNSFQTQVHLLYGRSFNAQHTFIHEMITINCVVRHGAKIDASSTTNSIGYADMKK